MLKRAKNEEGRDVGVEKRTHPKKTRFLRRARGDANVAPRSRRWAFPRLRERFFVNFSWRKTQEDNLVVQRAKEEGQGPPEKNPLLGPRRGGAMCLFLNGSMTRGAYSRRRCRRRRRHALFDIKTDSGLFFLRHSRRAGRRVKD